MSDDIVGVLTQRIEERFTMSVDDMRRAVTAAPGVLPDVEDVVRWHGYLVDDQKALETGEDALLDVLARVSGELDESAMALAHQVNALVARRDGRAMVLSSLLDPDVPGRRGPAVWRGATVKTRPITAFQEGPLATPSRPAAAASGVIRR